MSQWKNDDSAANSVLWGVVGYNKTGNSSNRDTFFGNTTADAYVTGITVGQYGVSTAELGGSSGVATVSVANSGSGFTVRPTVSFSGGGGTSAAATATAKLVQVTVGNDGAGYLPGDNLTIAGGTGTSAVANVTSISLETVQINEAGSGYANGNVISLTTGTGTQATFQVTTGVSDTVPASLAVLTEGSYTVAPTLANAATTVVPSGGTGLTVDVTTAILAVAIKTAGSYTVLPTLTGNQPTGGNGTGAELNLSMGVNQVTVTNSGSGYTSAPNVSFGGTGGSGASGTSTLQSSEESKITHAGWVVRKEGSGGRAGRVQYETLVAMGSITGDAEDDSKLPE